MSRGQLATRIDAFPEDYDYRDEGCDLAPACLACPFPACRYDDAAPLLRARAAALREFLQQGANPRDVASKLGVSLRTVQRHNARRLNAPRRRARRTAPAA